MSSKPDCSFTDILITGAGPVGLTLANELTRHGIRCRIVDRAPNASEKTKALGVMTRTLELFEKMGVAETFIARGHMTYSFHLFSEGKQLVHLEFKDLIRSPYAFVLMVPQNVTEEILNGHLSAQGGKVERQVELIGFSQREDGVEATLRHPDGREETVFSQWLIGCDGAHSTVRHTLGIEFGGTTFEQSFALADVHMEWTLDNRQIYAFLHKGDVVAYFPMDEGRRHRIIISHKIDKEQAGDVTLEEIQQVIDSCGPHGARACDPTWLARFRVNQRKVNRYIQGRAILAGDAAHIHSPLGAQGMNTGIQDAFNLAWKLALVTKGRASQTLIHSYEAEREPVGEELVKGTGRFTTIALMDNAVPVSVRDRVAPLVLSFGFTQQRLAGAISETSISYRNSPIVYEEKKGLLNKLLHQSAHPSAGDRAPDGIVMESNAMKQTHLFTLLRETRHVLLMFAGLSSNPGKPPKRQEIVGPVADKYAEDIAVYRIETNRYNLGQMHGNAAALYDPDGQFHRIYGCEEESFVLIRPDGYIGFRSSAASADELMGYLGRLFKA